jgi:hypothetical protein
MGEQIERAEITVRCAYCARSMTWCRATALARFIPVPPPVRWQVDRIDRVPWERQPWKLGTSPLGDPRFGLAADDGTLPSPRMLPVPLSRDARSFEFPCRECGRSTLAKVSKRQADRAAARGKTEIYA